MVILIPHKDNPHTGKGHFISRLAAELRRQGHKTVHRPDYAHDVYLDYNAFRWKTDRPKVLRLNGVYINKDYPSGNANKGIRHECKKADGLIYQSEFCKRMNLKYTSHGLDKPSQVIFNGAPILQKAPQLATQYKHTFVACARWRPHKRLSTILSAFVEANIPSSELVVMGKFKPRDVPNVKWLGKVEDIVVEMFMANATASLHLAYLDWAPNSVVESLAAGCPVICTDSGGTKEVVLEGCGKVLEIDKAYDGGMVSLRNPPKIDHVPVAKAMKESLGWPRVENNQHVNIENVAEQYVAFMRKFT